MTHDTNSLAPGQIRITVEIGSEYDMSDALTSLLAQMQAEIADDDVSGYALDFSQLRNPPARQTYLKFQLTNVHITSIDINASGN